MDVDVEGDEQLQIDLSCSSKADLKSGTSGAAERHSAMTWLQAAEHVLREESPGMHIRDLTRTILELGMVKSSCSTSLETLLYRQTSKGTSKFIRVPGKMGWFGLKTEQAGSTPSDQKPAVVLPSQSEQATTGGMFDGRREGEVWDFHPKVFYKRKKKTSDCSASGSEDSDWTNSSDEDSEALYHKRYIFTKKMAKSIIYENVALAEQLNLIEQKIATAEAERKFLLDKFMKFNQKNRLTSKKSIAVSVTDGTANSVFKASGSMSFTGTTPITLPPAPPPLVPVSNVTTTTTCGSDGQGGVDARAGSTLPKTTKSCLSALLSTQTDVKMSVLQGSVGQEKQVTSTAPGSGDTVKDQKSLNPPGSGQSSSVSSSSESECEAEDTTAVLGAGETEPKAKGSRRKVGSKVRRLHPIPLHDDGSPMLPIQIGGLQVHSLGKIMYDRAAYHSERYLLPVGFNSSRTYPSMLSPSRRTTYHCTILDGGDAPIFEMRAEDDAENPVQAASSTACQSIVLKAINKARDRQATNSGSGPEFFGYSNPTILNLLQKLPNAGRCSKYKFIKFDSPVRPVAKSATKRKSTKLQKGDKVEGPQTKKQKLVASPKPDTSSSATATSSIVRGGGGVAVYHSRHSTPTDPSLAPVLGPGMSQFGLETGMGLYSSSEEWSSSDTEQELTVDL